MSTRQKGMAVLMVTLVTLLMGVLAVGAQEQYPTRPVTFIIPSGPGGMCDTTARFLSKKMEEILGQPILIVDKPGASGVVGWKYFLRQKPDGYTVLYTWSGPAQSIYFQEKRSFDLEKFKFVGRFAAQPRILFAQIDAPYKTWEEFIDYVKKRPGEVTVGGRRMSFEILKSIAVIHGNLKMKYVLFASGGEVSSAILGGHVDVAENGAGAPAYQAAVAGEKVRPLINLGTGTVPHFPELPSVRSKYYPFALITEYGMMLPVGVPEYIREYWENVLKKVMKDPEVINRFKEWGFSPAFRSGKDWETIIKVCSKSVPALFEFNKFLEE